MKEERIEPNGVPARIYQPPGAVGLLLFGHGGGHSKDSPRFVRLARRYATGTGLAVVCIDAVDHGERNPNNASPGIPSGWHSSAVGRMVRDWQGTAQALSSIGPAVAYVGFSMGAIFGVPTGAAMPGVKAVVLGVGGIPSGPWLDDPALPALVLEAASGLGGREVLMLNKTDDEFFPAQSAHALFDAIPGTSKRLMFWPGPHDDWPDEAVELSIAFINRVL